MAFHDITQIDRLIHLLIILLVTSFIIIDFFLKITNGSKGNGFSRATRVNIKRNASDTVNPIAASTTVASSLMCSSILARTTAFADILDPSPQYGDYVVAQNALPVIQPVTPSTSRNRPFLRRSSGQPAQDHQSRGWRSRKSVLK